jgi:hypothetical protein
MGADGKPGPGKVSAFSIHSRTGKLTEINPGGCTMLQYDSGRASSRKDPLRLVSCIRNSFTFLRAPRNPQNGDLPCIPRLLRNPKPVPALLPESSSMIFHLNTGTDHLLK